MRFLLVVGLALLAWIGIGRWSAASVVALGAGILLGSVLALSLSARVRVLAPLAPASALVLRLLTYAAWPLPPRPILALVLAAIAAAGLYVSIKPLAARSRAARLLAGLCLSGALLCPMLAGTERIFRSYEPVDPYAIVPASGTAAASAFGSDPELGMVLRPGFRGSFSHPEYAREKVEINADGFRDLPWPAPGDPEAAGVLLLGDSTLFGLGVEREETISQKLEGLLAARHSSRRIRFFNAGVSSYGPRHELVLLQRLLGRLHPRLCIAVFYDGNDLEDCRRQYLESRKAGLHAGRLPSEDQAQSGTFRAPDLLATPAALSVPPLWTRLYWARYTSLFRELDRRLAHFAVRWGWMPVTFAYNNDLLRSTCRQMDLDIQEEFDLALEAVAAMSSECRRRGIGFVLVRLPACLQAEPTNFSRALSGLGLDPQLFDRRRPGSLLVEEARRQGIQALDLLPALQVGEGELSPFYFREGHPDRAGNQRIAEAIAAFLEQGGLLEQEPEARAGGR